MARIAALLPIAILIACGDPNQPPYWREVCIKSETYLMPMWIVGANGQMTLIFIPQENCVQHEKRCVWGDEYDGPKICPTA